IIIIIILGCLTQAVKSPGPSIASVWHGIFMCEVQSSKLRTKKDAKNGLRRVIICSKHKNCLILRYNARRSSVSSKAKKNACTLKIIKYAIPKEKTGGHRW